MTSRKLLSMFISSIYCLTDQIAINLPTCIMEHILISFVEMFTEGGENQTDTLQVKNDLNNYCM